MNEKKRLKVVTGEQAEIEARKREARVFELRIQGFTFEQIASEVGYQGASGAWQAYKRVKESHIFESVDEARQLELMRLDEMMLALWDRAIGGDLPAASCVLKIMDRRAKLLGLDKPEKIEVNKWDISGQDIDAEVQRIVTIINEREDQFMERREREVREEMQAEFEKERNRQEMDWWKSQNWENMRWETMDTHSRSKMAAWLGIDITEL
jgi:hypothetical protein